MKTLYLYYLNFRLWLRRTRFRQQLNERIRRITQKPLPSQSEIPAILAIVRNLLFLEYVKASVLVTIYISLWLMFVIVYLPEDGRPPSFPIHHVNSEQRMQRYVASFSKLDATPPRYNT